MLKLGRNTKILLGGRLLLRATFLFEVFSFCRENVSELSALESLESLLQKRYAVVRLSRKSLI